MGTQEQKHPREKSDRAILENLLQGQPDDYNLLELARLTIRYQGFPGARDIQQGLQQVLQNWQLTEDQLYQKTRQIYQGEHPYRDRFKGDNQQDWT